MNQQPHQAANPVAVQAVPPHAELPVVVAAAQPVSSQAAADKMPVAAKPVTAAKLPTAAAAIQMDQEAASKQAKQAVDKLLRKKMLGESEGDQGAESSVDTAYEVAAADTTEAATPPAEATAAGASTTAVPGGMSWLPVAGGGLGIAAIGGGGGTAAAATAAAPSTFAVSLGAVAGPVTAALNYKIYDAQGNLVASGVTDATGKVTVNLSSTYAGQALLISITDANGAAADFRDEASNAAASLGSTALRASFVATGGSQSITVSPLTELAVQKMGITSDAATASAATVNATNASVGTALGVADILGAVTTVLSADYNEANGLSAAEIYGQALAKLSGLDLANGSMSATFTALLNALNITDTTVRAATLATLLNDGAVRFEGGANSGSATLPVLPTLTITDSVATGPTNAAVTYTFTFSEAVTGFDVNDITVTNGTKGAFSATSATVYTLIVTPTANAQGADIGVSVNSGTGGIGYQGTLTSTIAKSAGAQAYDTIAPAAPSAPNMTDATDNGASNSDNLTHNTTPTFTGTAEANATVTLYEGTTVLGTGTANAAGSYSVTSSVLTEGAHTLTVKATDAAGNVSAASSGLNLTIDTIAPAAATIDMVATDDTINASEQSAAITGTNELGATVALSLGGNTRAATITGTTWSYTLTAADITAMGQGSETLSVTQTDEAGNASTAATRAISVDTVAANETVVAAISHASAGTIATATAAAVAATILDNDQSIWSVASAGNVGEGAGFITYTVTRTGATHAAATIQFATTGGTATASTDYTAVTETLSFAAGESSKTITVAINDDANAEGLETVVAAISNASAGTIATAAVAATILDNDQSIWIVDGGGNVSEGAGFIAYTVTRTGATNTAEKRPRWCR